MKNEIELNTETKTKNELIKCKKCGQYFAPHAFRITSYKTNLNFSSCRYCRQQQIRYKKLKD